VSERAVNLAEQGDRLILAMTDPRIDHITQPSLLKFVQQPAQAACQSADNSQRDVEPETLALCVDNFASDEPSD